VRKVSKNGTCRVLWVSCSIFDLVHCSETIPILPLRIQKTNDKNLVILSKISIDGAILGILGAGGNTGNVNSILGINDGNSGRRGGDGKIGISGIEIHHLNPRSGNTKLINSNKILI
jgi:hypothetical protein